MQVPSRCQQGQHSLEAQTTRTMPRSLGVRCAGATNRRCGRLSSTTRTLPSPLPCARPWPAGSPLPGSAPLPPSAVPTAGAPAEFAAPPLLPGAPSAPVVSSELRLAVELNRSLPSSGSSSSSEKTATRLVWHCGVGERDGDVAVSKEGPTHQADLSCCTLPAQHATSSGNGVQPASSLPVRAHAALCPFHTLWLVAKTSKSCLEAKGQDGERVQGIPRRAPRLQDAPVVARGLQSLDGTIDDGADHHQQGVKGDAGEACRGGGWPVLVVCKSYAGGDNAKRAWMMRLAGNLGRQWASRWEDQPSNEAGQAKASTSGAEGDQNVCLRRDKLHIAQAAHQQAPIQHR